MRCGKHNPTSYIYNIKLKVMITVTIERLNEIEQERNETTATPEFQEWF